MFHALPPFKIKTITIIIIDIIAKKNSLVKNVDKINAEIP
jgi:hypothetical protein